MNKNIDNYNLLTDLSSDYDTFKYLIDTANSKYNNSNWRNLTDVMPATRSKKFSTIIDETGVIVKASVIGSMAKKPLRSVEGGKSYMDSMPKIGHGFKVDQSDMNYLEELNLADANVGKMMTETYINRASNIIGGFHAIWNTWAYQALSNQEIVLNNLGGASTTIDLHTNGKLKLKAKGNSGWFVDATTSDIIKDLQRMVKVADDNNVKYSYFVCSKSMLDKITSDAKVLASIKASMPFTSQDAFISPKKVVQLLVQIFELPPIIAIDEMSRHEEDGVAVESAKAFNVNKISLVSAGKLFNMHNSPSDYTKDHNPSTIKTVTEGGLIGGIQIFGSEPIEIITNMESWSFLTFKNPDQIVTLDASVASATGK